MIVGLSIFRIALVMNKALIVSLALLGSHWQAAHASPDIDLALAARSPEARMSRAPADFNTVTDRSTELIMHALSSVGIPYRLGGSSAKDGFDCSGLVLSTYEKSLGLKLPRTAAQQAAATRKISRKELKPGDLVFFNTMRRAYSHVGIYMGEGKFIHAPRTGAHVRIESMNVPYWQKRFNGARRVLDRDLES